MATPVLDKGGTRIRRMFGDIAPQYDFLNHLLSLNIDKLWRRKTVRLAPIVNGGPLLDLCTGTGDLAFAYRDAFGPSVQIVGADFCHPMLVRAEKKSRERKSSDIRFIEADAQELPFPANTFELVTVAFGLRNVADTDRGISEMVRVIRPGGRVAILEFSKSKHWLMGRMYGWYFRFVLPLVGQFFSRSRDSAYRYLPESVMQFPEGEEMLRKLESHGLKNVKQHRLTFGIATLYVGEK